MLPGRARVGGLSTARLTAGALAILLAVARGASAQGVDAYPTIEILSPAPNALVQYEARIQARCIDDRPGCTLSVRGGWVSLESPTGVIDTPVSLVDNILPDILYFTAVDSAGQAAYDSRDYITEHTHRLTPVESYGASLFEIDDTRALIGFPNDPVPTFRIVNRQTRATELLVLNTGYVGLSAWLTTTGALVLARDTAYSHLKLFEWRNGAVTDLGFVAGPIRDEGVWAAYVLVDAACCTNPRLVRRRLDTGQVTTIATVMPDGGLSVAANGDVVYALKTVSDYDFHFVRYHNGTVTRIVDDNARSAGYFSTDGELLSYVTWRVDPSADLPTLTQLVTPNGVETLAQNPYWTAPPFVAHGWTAFLRSSDEGYAVWLRAPDGSRRQLAMFRASVSSFEQISPNGDLLLSVTGGVAEPMGRYLLRASGGPPIWINEGTGFSRWADGAWKILRAQYVMAIVTDTVSTLAEGATGSFFDLDVAILNPTPDPIDATVSFYREDGVAFDQARTIPAHTRQTIHVNDQPGLESAAVATVVRTTGAPLVVERTMTWDATGYGGHSGSASEAPRMRWLFAEGAQGYFDTYFLLVNDGGAPATVTLTFLVERGSPVTRTVAVLPHSRATFHTGGAPELMNRSFSTIVESSAPIVAERAMYFGDGWIGGHESAGVSDAATSWFHAEGATGPVFDTFILVGNPNPSPTDVSFRFLTDMGVVVTTRVTVPAFGRHTLSVDNVSPQLADASFAVTVSAGRPIVSERAMYWSTTGGAWQEAHNSFGVTTSAVKWGLADGRTGGSREYQTFVLIANPGASAASVKITFMRDDGLQIERSLTLEPNRRATVRCNDVPELANAEFGVVVDSLNGQRIVVERATYWNANGVTWAGGANVTGTPIP